MATFGISIKGGEVEKEKRSYRWSNHENALSQGEPMKEVNKITHKIESDKMTISINTKGGEWFPK